MHKLKDTTAQIKIIKKTQGYTLGKPNEGENNPGKLFLLFKPLLADTLPLR